VKLEFSRQIFEKSSNLKFLKNPSFGSRVVLCGHTDRQTDMTKPIVAFRNFENVFKNTMLDLISGQRSAACYRTGSFPAVSTANFLWRWHVNPKSRAQSHCFNGLMLCIRIYMRERMHEIENNGIGFVCCTHGMEDSNCARTFSLK